MNHRFVIAVDYDPVNGTEVLLHCDAGTCSWSTTLSTGHSYTEISSGRIQTLLDQHLRNEHRD